MKQKHIKLKIDPLLLPKPLLPPTRERRIGEVVPISEVAGLLWNETKGPAFNGKRFSHEELASIARKSGRIKKLNAWTPEKDAELIRLRQDGKSYHEITEITGRSLSAIEHRLHRLQKEGKYQANRQRRTGSTGSDSEGRHGMDERIQGASQERIYPCGKMPVL